MSTQTILNWIDTEERLRSSYRRLVASRLPVNLYSAKARAQRRAASLLHGMAGGTGQWEELDGFQFADDARGDRTSLLLGGVAGGVALISGEKSGLLASAGTGTLFISNVEKMATAAQRVLSRIIESERYTPLGDPFPRPVNCRIIVATRQPMVLLARGLYVSRDLAALLGRISLRAEDVIHTLEREKVHDVHPGTLAAVS